MYDVEIAYDLTDIDAVCAERLRVRDRLEKSVALWKATGKRPTEWISFNDIEKFYDKYHLEEESDGEGEESIIRRTTVAASPLHPVMEIDEGEAVSPSGQSSLSVTPVKSPVPRGRSQTDCPAVESVKTTVISDSCCFGGLHQVDCMDYYTERLKYLNKEVADLQEVYSERRQKLDEAGEVLLKGKLHAHATALAGFLAKRAADRIEDIKRIAQSSAETTPVKSDGSSTNRGDSAESAYTGRPETPEEELSAEALEIQIREEMLHRSPCYQGTMSLALEAQELQRQLEESTVEVPQEQNAQSSSSKSTGVGARFFNTVTNAAALAERGVGELAGGIAKHGIQTAKIATRGAVKGVLEATRTLELLTVGAYYKTSSTAFVTLTSRVAASSCCQMLLSHEFFRMEIRSAPNPKDIIWDNVSIPQSQIELRKKIADSTLVVGALFWSIVVGCITTFSNLDSIAQEATWLNYYKNTTAYILLNEYLAVAILLILLNILPAIFDMIARNYGKLSSSRIALIC